MLRVCCGYFLVQWGNPNEEEYYEYMKSYSPIDNIKAGVNYPRTLLTAGLNDRCDINVFVSSRSIPWYCAADWTPFMLMNGSHGYTRPLLRLKYTPVLSFCSSTFFVPFIRA